MRRHGSRHPRAWRFARFSRRDVRSVSGSSPARSIASWHDVLGDGDTARHERARPTARTAAERQRSNGTHGHVANGRTATRRRPARRARCRRSRARARSRCRRSRRRRSRSVWPLVNAYRSRGHFAREPRSARAPRDRARSSSSSPTTWGFTDARPRARRSSRPACTACRARRSRELLDAPARDLRGLGRPRVHAHLVAGAPQSWLAERMETALATPLPTRRPHAHARAADQRRAVRAVLPHEVSRHEAVLARGQRER